MNGSTFHAGRIYDEAADDYERIGRRYWSFLAERTVDRVAPAVGARVLDAAAGTGFATLPAAERVGQAGRVVAVDIAPRMLDMARRRAMEHGVADRVEFVETDMTVLDGVAGEFDAVLCVLGLFFVDDMVGLLRSLWARVRPGGTLAITTLGPEFFEPLTTRFRDTMYALRPDVVVDPPWRRTDDPAVVAELFVRAGLPEPLVVIEREALPAHSPDDLWGLIMGTGLRASLTSLSPDEIAQLRDRVTSTAGGMPLSTLYLSAIYASCRRPV